MSSFQQETKITVLTKSPALSSSFYSLND